ncbi:MAG: ROK family protein [Oscillospiraceae bacterium]|nr:ROK family protein [Oscillospiraceae bacterium]MDD4368033.1 ROK family protein [Oscillospiraceae bacterium]
MNKHSQTQIRAHNESLVLETLLLQQPLSRAQLSRRTRLNKVTISEIVSHLMAQQLIVESGSGQSRSGRRPTLLEINAGTRLALAIDLRPDEWVFYAAWLDGSSCGPPLIMPAPVYQRDAFLPALQLALQQFLQQLPERPLAGLCLGIHGNVYENRILFTPYYHLAELDLAGPLQLSLHCPVYLMNEANLCALGDLGLGLAQDNFISISIHSGIGAGLIQNGRLQSGQQGFSGEIGHLIAVPGGKPCPCGNYGCVEQYASERALLDRYRELSGATGASFEQFLNACRADQPAAADCLNQFVAYMAILLNNVCRLTDPAAVVLHSRLATVLPNLLPRIAAAPRCRIPNGQLLQPSQHDLDSTGAGGIYLVLQQFYGVERLKLKR